LLRFTRFGITYDLPRLTWGWATTGCSRIFGYSYINADAFFQNSYTVFAGHQWDFQASSEHGNHKTGIRYRTRREDGESYRWRYDDATEIEGNYYADPYWKDRQEARLIRGPSPPPTFRSVVVQQGHVEPYPVEARLGGRPVSGSAPEPADGRADTVLACISFQAVAKETS
jgi:hypothetical protein